MAPTEDRPSFRRTMWKTKYGWSLLASITLIAVIAGIASIPGCENSMLLLLPGAFLAALIFPEGVNSSGGVLFLVFSGLLDILIASLLIFGAWSVIRPHRTSES